jgi:hypothetical protein
MAAKKQSVVASDEAAAAAEANCLAVVLKAVELAEALCACCVVVHDGEVESAASVCEALEVAAPNDEVPVVAVPLASAIVSTPFEKAPL